MRVIVTGSRDWSDVDQVHDALDSLFMKWQAEESGKPFVLVHGDARGADRIADQWARQSYCRAAGVVVEKYPYWSQFRKAGGPMRNQHMVNLGADYAVGFIQNFSTGASGCIAMAQKAGIETIVYRRNIKEDIDVQ